MGERGKGAVVLAVAIFLYRCDSPVNLDVALQQSQDRQDRHTEIAAVRWLGQQATQRSARQHSQHQAQSENNYRVQKWIADQRLLLSKPGFQRPKHWRVNRWRLRFD